MKAKPQLLLGVLLLGCSVTANEPETVAPEPADPPAWRLYDAMHDRPGPQASLGRYGIAPMHVFMLPQVYPPGADRSRPPTEAEVKAFARKLPTEVLTCMDFEGEQWCRIYRRRGDRYVLWKDHVEIRVRIARWINQANPELRWGYFWSPPLPGPTWQRAFRAQSKGNADAAKEHLEQWREMERALEPLRREVDVLMPSLYFSPIGQDLTWEQFQARTEFFLAHVPRPLGKPMVPFVCPLDPYSNTPRGANFLTGEQWRWVLDTVREHADGAALWSDVPFEWDAHARGRAWWRETIRFLKAREPSAADRNESEP